MTTIVSLSVNTDDHNFIVDQVSLILGKDCKRSKEPCHEDFINSRSAPTNYVIHTFSNGWTSIQYNSWSRVEDLIEKISVPKECLAIRIHYQSVSSAACISVIKGGDLIREIEYSGDAGLTKNIGIPFDFEDETPLRIEYDEDFDEEFEHFGMEEIEEYCLSLGLNWQELDDCIESTYVTKIPNESFNRSPTASLFSRLFRPN